MCSSMLTTRFLLSLILTYTTLAAPTVNNSTVVTSSAVVSPSAADPPSVVSGVSSAVAAFVTAGTASDDANDQVFPQDSKAPAEAINGQLGGSLIAPDDTVLDDQNPDLLAPPSTDAGTV